VPAGRTDVRFHAIQKTKPEPKDTVTLSSVSVNTWNFSNGEKYMKKNLSMLDETSRLILQRTPREDIQKGITSGYVPLGAVGCTDAVMEPIDNYKKRHR
jgi:hypothetical protein